jgi:hypothetical protein
MKINKMNTIIGLLVVAMVLSISAFGQDPDALRQLAERVEKSRREQAAIDQGVEYSRTARAIHESSGKERSRLLSDAVQAGDSSIIPYLIAAVAANWSGSPELEVALVQLGEKEYFDKTVTELSSKDATVRYYAIWKLAMFKTKGAYRKLYELLDDEAVRDDGDHGDYIVLPLAHIAKERLASTVDNPPKGKDAYDTAAWKAWFAKNKHLIE